MRCVHIVEGKEVGAIELESRFDLAAVREATGIAESFGWREFEVRDNARLVRAFGPRKSGGPEPRALRPAWAAYARA